MIFIIVNFMKRCCFIIPYFGKLPNYFELFAKSCGYNTNYDWIIFTNDNHKYRTPKNVKIILMNFQEVKRLIQSKFDFKISLDKPYKLCDYKPAFGYIFEEYIKNYRFWGHCDLDTLIGDLNNFITEEMLEKYDKLFCLGHFVLYKNSYENNRLFMSKYNNIELYKKVFTDEKIMIFDETYGNKDNINSIYLNNKKNVFMQDISLNFNINFTKFIRTTFDFDTYSFINEEYKKAIYIWKKGKIIRVYKEGKELKWEEFLYVHFQQRNMKFDKKILDNEIFKFVPNKFLPIEIEDIDYENFSKIKRRVICFHTLEMHLKWKIKKISKLFKNK